MHHIWHVSLMSIATCDVPAATGIFQAKGLLRKTI
jgi:hypothetical protein